MQIYKFGFEHSRGVRIEWSRFAESISEGAINPESINSTTDSLIIGNFDGFHRGHQNILRTAWNLSGKGSSNISILTFRPHPMSVFSKEYFPLLNDEQIFSKLESWGVNSLFVLNFDSVVSELSSADFLEKILGNFIRPKRIFVGFDFKFGKSRSGGIPELKTWANQRRIHRNQGQDPIDVVVADSFNWNEVKISTTEIKNNIIKGDLPKVPDMLGHPFSIVSKTQSGAKIGTQIGVPTVNLILPKQLLPSMGVYLTQFRFYEQKNGVMNFAFALNESKRWYTSISNLGAAPTVGRGEVLLECHGLNLSTQQREILGKGVLENIGVEVRFLAKCRQIVEFENTEALKNQIKIDIEWAKEKIIELGII